MAQPKKICLVRLSFVTYQHPNLDRAVAFLEDFGLIPVKKELNRIYFGGYGIDPYVYVAEQSPDSKNRFLGGTWTVNTAKDLEIAANRPEHIKTVENPGPGGGKLVTLEDPNGYPVTFLHGQQLRSQAPSADAMLEKDENTALQNLAFDKPRQGKFRRFGVGPSLVHKAGHYGYMVPKEKFKSTFEWYTSVMALKPTDSVFDPVTKEDKTCFLHVDRGQEHTDHHASLSQHPSCECHTAS
jgi:catechol 2,3-dioxygenase-like lactoylglutathione lyase family enzyme